MIRLELLTPPLDQHLFLSLLLAMSFFISGTDTGIGKTVFSAVFCRYLQQKGYNTAYYKPVQSGSILRNNKYVSGDLDFVQDFAHVKGYCSYLFKRPASPHLSAELENKSININKIQEDFNHLSQKHEIVVTEGAGGLFVPLDREGTTMGHLCQQLKLPLLLVGRADLGTINHTGLSVQYARSLGIMIHSIFLLSYQSSPEDLENDNVLMLKKILKIKNIFRLPAATGVDVDEKQTGKMDDLFKAFNELLKNKEILL